ncbi:microfibrillar-associated protein 1-like [Styela clava]|uniref:microfibrillar-associated protein 1-like n=1 Tax=Styela clava TaxID=7725 RepID=UPI00193AA1C8|nr:microfibrillar-associated protein 1-like [Styela clava]
MFTLGQERFLEESSKPQPIMFTAGAVSIRNEKGEISMKKVKVKRYVAGKKPEWAPELDLDRDSDDEGGKFENKNYDRDDVDTNYEMRDQGEQSHSQKSVVDRRLQRLMDRSPTEQERGDRLRHRRNFEPEVISEGEDSEPEESKPYSKKVTVVEEESSDDEDLDDDEIENRRMLLRQRVQAKRQTEEELFDQVQQTSEVHIKEEEMDRAKSSDDDEEFTSESEYSDSEDEGPRLKPVFVRKKDRITIQEREEEEKLKNSEEQARKVMEERRKYTLQLVEKEARMEVDEENKLLASVKMVDSDDGNDEDEYEAWKLRELKRIKRDRDEREAEQKAKEEAERLRNMTEEERKAELRNNPKVVTNQLQKGKYKFLQKYYHRGAFYLDEEDDTLKRDITNPTLEDHFDKSVLPKVMQVKNFGRSGRTKYTHLLDQDTTVYDSPWNQDNALSGKFMSNKGGGMKQNFERPSGKQRKT